MKFHFQWKKSFVLLLLLSLTVFLFAISQFLLRPSSIDNQKYIPKSAQNVIRFNGKSFFDEAVYTLLFKSKEQALLVALGDEINKKRKGKGKSTEFGIDFLTDIFLFQEAIPGGEVTVLIFELAQARKFKKNAAFFLSENQCISVDGSTGLFFSYTGEKRSNSELQKHADSYLKQTSDEVRFSKASNSILEIELDRLDLFGFELKTKEKIGLKMNENSIQWKGKVNSTLNNNEFPNWHLKPEFTHFTTSLVSKDFNDSLFSQSNLIGMSLPPISYFSVNYGGLLIQDSESLRFTPKIDLLIQFKEKTSRTALFNNPKRLEELGFKLENNRLLAGALTYFIDSLDERTFFIGLNRLSVLKGKTKTIFALQGDLSYLTQIDGGGFIGNIIQFNPKFKAFQQYFSKLEKCDFKWENSNFASNFSGELRFKKDSYLITESMRLFLGLN